MYAFFSAWLVPILLEGLLGLPGLSKAEFVPPRIIQVVHSFDVGELPDSLANLLQSGQPTQVLHQ